MILIASFSYAEILFILFRIYKQYWWSLSGPIIALSSQSHPVYPAFIVHHFGTFHVFLAFRLSRKDTLMIDVVASVYVNLL